MVGCVGRGVTSVSEELIRLHGDQSCTSRKQLLAEYSCALQESFSHAFGVDLVTEEDMTMSMPANLADHDVASPNSAI